MKTIYTLLLIFIMLAGTSVGFANEIESISSPSQVSPGQNIPVSFTYRSNKVIDIVVSLKQNGGDWTIFGHQRYTISNTKGNSSTRTITFILDKDTPLGNNYVIEIKMFDDNTWETEVSHQNAPVRVTSSPEEIISVSVPDELYAGQTANVNFTYSASQTRDLAVSLKNTNTQKTFGSQTHTVNTATRSLNTKTFTIDSRTPEGSTYRIEVKMFQKGTNNLISQQYKTVKITEASNDELDAKILNFIQSSNPKEVHAGQLVEVGFNYIHSVTSDVVVSLKNRDTYEIFGSQKYTLYPGSQASRKLNFTVNSTTPVGNDYIIEVKAFTQGTNQVINEASYYASVLQANQTCNNFFKINNAKLYDGNGNPFIMRGINIQFVHYINQYLNSIDNIVQTNTNALRIEWRMSKDGSVTDINDLESIIKKCIENKMIPVVELHDYTGDDKESNLLQLAKYWADNVWLLQKYKDKILVNIANEWGDWDMDGSYWKNAYISAVNQIREAGFYGTLIIDAYGSGQRVDGIKQYAHELLQVDSNLLFSAHTYDAWADGNYDIATELAYFHEEEIPFMVGEFGSTHHRYSDCFIFDVDDKAIMRYCEEYGHGYFAWSWKGNGWYDKCDEPLAYLDMVNNWEQNDYTTWGATAVEHLRKTAKECSIFQNTAISFTSTSNTQTIAAESIVYPNPFSYSDLQIKLGSNYDVSKPIQVDILTFSGISIQEKIWIPKNNTILLAGTSSLQQGNYIVQVSQEGKIPQRIRVLKK